MSLSNYDTRVIVSPRRNGKSSAIALISAFELLCMPQAFVVWCSGSGDQASDIIEQKLRRPLALNPKTRDLNIQASRNRLVNVDLGSVIEVIAPAEASAPGRTVSLLVIDEARSVPEEVYEILRPSAASGKIYVVGSPSKTGTWFHRAATDPGPRDFVRSFKRLVNPAVPKRFVEGERERLKKRGAWGDLLWRREHGGEFVDLSENPLVTPSDIARASRAEVEPFEPSLDVTFAGVDLSTHRDLTSIAIVGKRGVAMRILETWLFDPKEQGVVDLAMVEARIARFAEKYAIRSILVDRFQGLLLCQNLRRRRVPIRDIAVTGNLNQAVFSALTEALSSRTLTWTKNPRLESELLNLELSENATGFSVKDRDRRLHRDLSFSLALAVWQASTRRQRPAGWRREPDYDPAEADVVNDSFLSALLHGAFRIVS